MTNAKTFQASLGRRKPTPQEIEKLRLLRQQDVEAILRSEVISADQINSLDWGGKFEIAKEHFDKCDDAAKHALLHDQSHPVRAAASVFRPRAKPFPYPRLGRSSAGDIAHSLMNGKEKIPTTHGDKTVDEIESMIQSTYPMAALLQAEKFVSAFERDSTKSNAGDLLAILRSLIPPAS